MNKIITFHAFQGGTGKSTMIANMGAILATQGLKVGLIDFDLEAPGLHLFFGLGQKNFGKTVNGYLQQNYPLSEAAYQISNEAGLQFDGELYLIPAGIDPQDVLHATELNIDHIHFSDGCYQLIEELELDLLLIDTHPGIDKQTLLSVACSDTVVLLTRPDEQDYRGTQLLLKAAERMQIPNVSLLLNKVPGNLDLDYVRSEVEREFKSELTQLIPFSAELMSLASGSLFAVNYPWHAITGLLKEIGNILLAQERDLI